MPPNEDAWRCHDKGKRQKSVIWLGHVDWTGTVTKCNAPAKRTKECSCKACKITVFIKCANLWRSCRRRVICLSFLKSHYWPHWWQIQGFCLWQIDIACLHRVSKRLGSQLQELCLMNCGRLGGEQILPVIQVWLSCIFSYRWFATNL